MAKGTGNFAELDSSGITAECLVETASGRDGSPLPAYPAAKPLLSIYRYVFPPHTVTADHYHKIINCGVVTRGELALAGTAGKDRARR